jgi:CBS domain-containing protein
MKVSQIMTEDVVTINQDSSISKAAKLMSDKLIGCLVVTEDDKIKGILTERDILSKVIAEERDATKVKVGEIMSSPVTCISSEETLKKAAHLMGEKRIRRLPVVDNEKLAGIVTSDDLVLGFKLLGRMPEILSQPVAFLIIGVLAISIFLMTWGGFEALLLGGYPVTFLGGLVLFLADLYFYKKLIS